MSNAPHGAQHNAQELKAAAELKALAKLEKLKKKLKNYNWQCYGFVQGTEKFNKSEKEMQIIKFKECDNRDFPSNLQPYIGTRLKILQQIQKCNIQDDKGTDAIDYVYPIEQQRFEQRATQTQQEDICTNTTSVILMACQAFEPESLQATLLPYVLCANAITYATQPYRLIICNSKATKESLFAAAIKRRVEIDLTQITFLPNINHIDILKNVISSIGTNEQLSLCYLSSHGSVNGGLYGYWDSSGHPTDLPQRELVNLAHRIACKKTADAQIFLNSCSSWPTANYLSRLLPETIVMGANNSIPTGSIHHHFAIDNRNGRICNTFNCIEPKKCEIFAALTHKTESPVADSICSVMYVPRFRTFSFKKSH